MKLYTTDGSPFGARVKIQIYKKNLPVEILAPPGGMGSAELKSLSPSAKIPVLALEDSIIIESEIIQEYLEDKFEVDLLEVELLYTVTDSLTYCNLPGSTPVISISNIITRR